MLWLQVVGRFEGILETFVCMRNLGSTQLETVMQRLAILAYIDLMQCAILIGYCNASCSRNSTLMFFSSIHSLSRNRFEKSTISLFFPTLVISNAKVVAQVLV